MDSNVDVAFVFSQLLGVYIFLVICGEALNSAHPPILMLMFVGQSL